QYIPPLSLVRKWEPHYTPITVKLSPGIDVAQVEPYHASLAFYSVNGELKEAELAIAMFGSPITAVLFLPGMDEPYDYQREEPAEAPMAENPAGWLNEPDPAIIRAGYVQHITNDYDGAMLDPTIAYFTTECKPDSVWVRSWRILDWMPFNLKKLKAYLKQRNIGTLTVKKRGSPITPEELESKLKLKGDNSLTVVLTRLHGNPIVIICEDYAP
ncbi:MAG: SAM-dependent methyltransferase, partial [Chloroflexota bacterium]